MQSLALFPDAHWSVCSRGGGGGGGGGGERTMVAHTCVLCGWVDVVELTCMTQCYREQL